MTKGKFWKDVCDLYAETGEALYELDRIREAAARDKTLRFTSLMHHITVDLLRTGYYALKRNAATGVDNVTWHGYGEDLESRIADLHGGCKVADIE